MEEALHENIVSELQNFVKENIIDNSMDLEANIPFRDLGVDSYSIIQIVLFIERRFKVSFQEADLIPENLRTINSLAEFVYKQN